MTGAGRTLLMAAAALFCAIAGAVDILDYVPTSSVGIIHVDLERLQQQDDIVRIFNDDELLVRMPPEIRNFIATMPLFRSMVVFFDKEDEFSGMLLELKSDSDIINFLKLKYCELTFESKMVNAMRLTKISYPEHEDNKVGLMDLGNRIYLAADYDQIIGISRLDRGLSKLLRGNLAAMDVSECICYSICDVEIAGERYTLRGTLGLEGDKSRDLHAKCSLSGKEDAVRLMEMMIPMYLAGASALVFGESPEVADQFIKSIKCNSVGRTLKMEMMLSSKLYRPMLRCVFATLREAVEEKQVAL